MTTYITYTQRVKTIISGMKYPFIDFDYNTDGSGYVMIKYHTGKYFATSFTNEEMKTCPIVMADLIISNVENYFNGWAVRKGYAVR